MIQGASSAVLRRQDLNPDARFGRWGEEAAYWHLRKQGFVMVEKNYRPQGLRGEIDLIGWDGSTLVFIEVKTRQDSGLLDPDAAVDREKARNVAAAARQYRRRAGATEKPFRFDIVSISAKRAAEEGDMEIRHFRDAFREPGHSAGA